MDLKPFYLILVTSLLSGCASLQPPPTESLVNDDYSLVKNYMSQYIPKAMKRAKMTGLSVALVDADKIVWSEGFGYADKAAKQPATAQTLYRAGSVSKLFTAIGIMQLVEQGRIDIDQPLQTYVPEFSINSRFGSIDEITLRNTLSHHSGIPDSYIDGMWADNPESYKTVATYLHDYYTGSAPNTVFGYSNAGYSLAGHALENVSNQAFSQYQQERILDVLSMTNSNFAMRVDNPSMSESYMKNKLVEELGLRDIPAGGLVTNVIDLSQLVIETLAVNNGKTRVLKSATLEAMMKPQRYESAYELTALNGLGFMHHPNIFSARYDAIGHGGQTMAHSAFVISVPELQIGAVLLGNTLNEGVLQDIMTELLRVAYPVKTGKALDLSDPPARATLPGTETSFNGQYATEVGLVSISKGPKKYAVKAMGQKLALAKDKKGKFTAKLKLLGFIPIEVAGPLYARDVNGTKLLVIDDKSTRVVFAKQIKEQSEHPEWHKRLGEYTPMNSIDTPIEMFQAPDITLGYQEGFYYLKLDRKKLGHPQYPIHIVDDTSAVGQGTGRGAGETIFAGDDNTLTIAGLVYVKK